MTYGDELDALIERVGAHQDSTRRQQLELQEVCDSLDQLQLDLHLRALRYGTHDRPERAAVGQEAQQGGGKARRSVAGPL